MAHCAHASWLYKCWVCCPQSCHAEKRQEWPGSAFGLERNTARDRCYGSDPDEGQGGMGRPDDDTGETLRFVGWNKRKVEQSVERKC